MTTPPEKTQEVIVDCDDEPKLTEDEWAYVEALAPKKDA